MVLCLVAATASFGALGLHFGEKVGGDLYYCLAQQTNGAMCYTTVDYDQWEDYECENWAASEGFELHSSGEYSALQTKHPGVKMCETPEADSYYCLADSNGAKCYTTV